VLARDLWKNIHAQRMLYMRGELLAPHWAAAMASRGESLQEALRSLRLPSEAREDVEQDGAEALATHRLLSALPARLGGALDREVTEYVDEGKTIPAEPDFLGPCFRGGVVRRPLFDLGWDFMASSAARTVTGLVPGSAAENAGVREGMKIAGWSIYSGSIEKEVLLQVRQDDIVREIRYLPHAKQAIRVYDFEPLPGAAANPDCRDWIEAR
jgi:predicted metalloprotease with PDZ domain